MLHCLAVHQCTIEYYFQFQLLLKKSAEKKERKTSSFPKQQFQQIWKKEKSQVEEFVKQ